MNFTRRVSQMSYIPSQEPHAVAMPIPLATQTDHSASLCHNTQHLPGCSSTCRQGSPWTVHQLLNQSRLWCAVRSCPTLPEPSPSHSSPPSVTPFSCTRTTPPPFPCAWVVPMQALEGEEQEEGLRADMKAVSLCCWMRWGRAMSEAPPALMASTRASTSSKLWAADRLTRSLQEQGVWEEGGVRRSGGRGSCA